MKRFFHIAGFCAVFAAAGVEAEVSLDEFKKLRQQCASSLHEPWRSIPWKISLLEAQRLAASEKKPLYIWAMDGHPLGCT